MQLTSAPIKDFLGYNEKGSYDKNLKTHIYGYEMRDLLISRGFDVDNAKTNKEKSELADKIFNYLKNNKDAEFNIKMGTLVLRRYQNISYKEGGHVDKTAYKYNNHPKHRQYYAKNVQGFYNTAQCDSLTTYERFKIT